MTTTLPLISVIGPTAVGKSQVALDIAQLALSNGWVDEVHLISADSRQVYQGLEVITGADIPVDFRTSQDKNFLYPYFEHDKCYLHGVSVIPVTHEWSVAHFHELVWSVVNKVMSCKAMIIMVGGTGLYHHHWRNQDPQLQIPPNEELRQNLSDLNLDALHHRLAELNPQRLQNMNHADRHNPRRLMRAIELEVAQPVELNYQPSSLSVSPVTFHELTFGLTDELEVIEQRITARVEQRLAAGAISEVERLHAISEDAQQKLPVFSSTGVREIMIYLQGEMSKDECIARWSLREFQYAKRQLTWWKKHFEGKWLMSSNAETLPTIHSTVSEFLTSAL
ncbi:MAG TPA: hypothetical protein VD999_00375 [Vitreimonas sp.]|nr:hypothetical protein [Vitreimonas sp.]